MSAPPLVYLHGFTGTGDDVEVLAPHWPGSRWWAPNLPGHGPETAPDRADVPATMPATVDWLHRQVLARGMPAGGWVGYSMGGRTALSFAVAHPECVRALVLVGATAGLADSAEAAERRASDEALAARAEALGTAAFVDAWSQTPLIRTQASVPWPDPSRAAALRRSHAASGLAASLRGMGTGAMPPLWEALPTLDVPVLLVVGEQDAKFAAIAERMARALRSAQVVAIAGAGHAAHLEAPAVFAAHAASFLRSHGCLD